MTKSKSEIREALAGLFLYWYGNHIQSRRLLRTEWKGTRDAVAEEVPIVLVEEAWRTRWFAKGDLTAKVDRELADNYSWLLEEPLLESFGSQGSDLWERLALIILISRTRWSWPCHWPQGLKIFLLFISAQSAYACVILKELISRICWRIV